MTASRPTLLLLPGLEGSGNLFDALRQKLNPPFETHIARYPATCRTYADAELHVRELLSGITPCAIIAESFSTPLAIQLAAEMPAAIRALILSNGFVSNPLSGTESVMAMAALPWFFHMPLTAIAARTFLVGPDAPDALVETVQHAIAPLAPTTLAARLQAVLRSDARVALAKLSVPTLYLHSTRDRLIGNAGVDQIRRIRPDLPIEPIDGPHLLLQREPHVCADLITRFLTAAT